MPDIALPFSITLLVFGIPIFVCVFVAALGGGDRD